MDKKRLIRDTELVADEFDSYWTVEKKNAVINISKEENLSYEKLVDVISNYLFTEKTPLRDEVMDIMNKRPSLRERKSVSERIITKIKAFVETFIDGMGGKLLLRVYIH